MAMRLAQVVGRRNSLRLLPSILRRSLCGRETKMDVTDLSDAYCDILQYVDPIFKDYGGKLKFGGKIATVKCHEDNVLVKQALNEPGDGRVLVVDGGGSMRRGMLGDRVATLAVQNNWVGIIMYGCIRDSVEIAKISVGVKALGTFPRKSEKKGFGERDIVVTFAGATFAPGHYLYADVDGMVVSPRQLTLPPPPKL